jgi:zinc/manganese transport system substrate-binding protein
VFPDARSTRAVQLRLSLSTAQAADKLPVVTSFSILADMVHQVGGEHIQITNMVGPDADAYL